MIEKQLLRTYLVKYIAEDVTFGSINEKRWKSSKSIIVKKREKYLVVLI